MGELFTYQTLSVNMQVRIVQNHGPFISKHGVENHGIVNCRTVYWNLTTPMLYEHAIRRCEGVVAHLGPLVVRTGEHTGRSPKDTFIVKEFNNGHDIGWGEFNRPIEQEKFDDLLHRMQAYVHGRDIFVFDGYTGAADSHRIPVRIITEMAWHSLFARNVFIRELNPDKLRSFVPGFIVINVPSFCAAPKEDGTNSRAFILVNLGKRTVLIGGTKYGGEMKNGIFIAMNYFLPRKGVLTMHCAANYGRGKDNVALFVGLSGTGKTTLSIDPTRALIGDDEHAWSSDGVFTLEGGCYATALGLDPIDHPEIYKTTRRLGTILENVVYDSNSRHLDLNDDSLTKNTSCCFPITYISQADATGVAGHPKNIFFLTTDLLGILPPISRLNKAQALYHFLSGYTARTSDSEHGIAENSVTFSPCFGAPFMPLPPVVYAELLSERIDRHRPNLWLVNTGWTGGPYGVGSRIKLSYTRRMIAAALKGDLNTVQTAIDPYFGVAVLTHVEGVPDRLLNPRDTWADVSSYHIQAAKLVDMFVRNFSQFEAIADVEIVTAGPKVPI